MSSTTEEAHKRMVAGLVKPGYIIKEQITPIQTHLLHMAVGVSGEAGELLDAVKKNVVYQKTLDLANVIEELGDLEFYMEGVRQALGLHREDILAANIKKLEKRYSKGKYSDEDAQNRADK